MNKYVTQLYQDSKIAYEMFRDRAIQSGLYKGSPEPLPRIHSRYYDKYVRNTQSSALNSRGPSGERQTEDNPIMIAEKARH